MQATAPLPDLAATFVGILDGLCRAIAARMVRRPSTIPLLMLLWTRLRRASRRFAALAERAAADRLAKPSAPRPRAPRAHQSRPRFPTFFGWVCHFVPSEAACYGSQLQALIARPEMATLLEQAPQAARLLRPLCHMLAVPRPAMLTPRPRPAGTPHAARATIDLPPADDGRVALWPNSAPLLQPCAHDPPIDADRPFRTGPARDGPRDAQPAGVPDRCATRSITA